MNIHVNMSLHTHMFSFLLGRFLSAISGMMSCGKCIYNIIRNSKAVFQSGCNILQSNKQYMSFPVPPHACQHLVWSDTSISAICLHSDNCGSNSLNPFYLEFLSFTLQICGSLKKYILCVST